MKGKRDIPSGVWGLLVKYLEARPRQSSDLTIWSPYTSEAIPQLEKCNPLRYRKLSLDSHVQALSLTKARRPKNAQFRHCGLAGELQTI
jgi:hypothetical protein